MEFVHIDLAALNPDTAAVLFYLDGGLRNFNRVNTVKMTCTRTRVISDAQSMHYAEDAKELKLCVSTCKIGKDVDCVALGVLFCQEGSWNVHHIHRQFTNMSPAEQHESLQTMVVDVIPQFEKFKPRLFPSVSSICAALSSHSLPQLKVSVVLQMQNI